MARIQTEGVVITSDDSMPGASFRLSSEEGNFPTPFWADNCIVRATADNYDLALRHGARQVRVHVPSREEPLYGVLAFCRTHPQASGPATRLYLIQVPEGRVEATAGGRVSVVFEPTNYQQRYADGTHTFDAWQLWLSEFPLR